MFGEQALPVRSDDAAPDVQDDLVLLLADLIDGQRDRRVRDVDDHVDPSTSYHWRAIAEPTSGLFW